MPTKDQILSFLKDNKERFERDFKVKRIGLFGSFAIGDNATGSDIDLIVSFIENVDNLYEKKVALKKLVSDEFHRDVDICSEKFLKPYFRDNILKQAIYV